MTDPRSDRQLEDDLRALGEGEEPPFGWQARVRARIEERRQATRPRRSWLPVLAAALAAAALALLFFSPSRVPPVPAAAFLHAEVVAGASARRGGEAHPGDELRLSAGTGGPARHTELRIYRDERELVLRVRNRLTATVRLAAPGRYRALLLFSARPLPPPAGDPEADTAAALAAGAGVEAAADVEVR